MNDLYHLLLKNATDLLLYKKLISRREGVIRSVLEGGHLEGDIIVADRQIHTSLKETLI